jgi:hypothetical protein
MTRRIDVGHNCEPYNTNSMDSELRRRCSQLHHVRFVPSRNFINSTGSPLSSAFEHHSLVLSHSSLNISTMKSIFASAALAILLAGTARAQGALNVTTPYALVFPANPVYELMISAVAAARLSASPPCFSGLAEFVCRLFVFCFFFVFF